MHNTVHENGVMSMHPVEALEVPAGGEVAFVPGGRHIMLYHPTRPYRAGDKVTLDLHFDGGERLRVVAEVRAAAPDQHSH
jgi:hypothetical protein